MRHIVAVILICGLSTVMTVTPANADSGGCVSRFEFDRIAQGMPATKVHKIFDTTGTVTGLGAPNTVRHYRTCKGGGMVQVVFSPRNRVLSKSGNFF